MARRWGCETHCDEANGSPRLSPTAQPVLALRRYDVGHVLWFYRLVRRSPAQSNPGAPLARDGGILWLKKQRNGKRR